MKESMKRITAALCAAAMALMIGVISVSASETARPQPDGSGATTATDTVNTSSGEAETAAPEATVNTIVSNTGSVTQNTSAASAGEKRYQTRLGGFLWFLLSVIVNFIISCWVGNRFYRLARRSTQSSAEIRALRKDIEEKFGSTLKDISEPAIEVMNQNENYARSDEGLGMPDRQSRVEINEEEREIFRRWDEQRTSSRTARTSAVREDDYDAEDEEEEYRPAAERRTSYRPTRRSSGIEFDDEEQERDYDYDDEYDDYEDARSSTRQRPARMNERRESDTPKKNGINKAKVRAKDFLSNVFPFDD